MKKLIILGASGFGREVCGWAEQSEACGREWQVHGFLDDNPRALEGYPCPYPVLGPISTHQPTDDELFVCAVGRPTLKRQLVGVLRDKGAAFTQVVHRSVIVGRSVRLGQGVILCPGCVLTCDITIGDHTALNLHCAVGHDAVIGSFCQLSSFSDITGRVRLADGVFLGSHATILPGMRVGEDAIIGAGSVVAGNVSAKMTVFGIPATPLRL